jgi:hypothetical protein
VAADRLQGQARYPRLWEKQQRGLAHVHGVISVSSPAELAWARDYVEALRELAPSKGFGFVDGWHKIGRRFWPGDQAGAYLSSYFVRGRGRKAPITENVLAGDLPRLVVFVGPHLTAKTCCTMRNLRNARRVWAWQQGLIDKPELEERDLDVAACLLHRPRSPPARPERDGAGAPPRERGARRRPARRTEVNGAAGAPAASPSHCSGATSRSLRTPQTTAFTRAASRNHSALSFGVRSSVSKST